jgi:hypothetical protein
LKSVYILLLLLLSQGTLYSQGDILKSGQSGGGFDLGFSANQDVAIMLANFGYSVEGSIDIGIALGKDASNASTSTYGSSFFYSPNLTFHAFKQDPETPLTVSLNAAYESISNTNIKESFISYGFMFDRSIDVTPKTRIQPTFGLSWLLETETQVGYQSSESKLGYIFSFPIIWETENMYYYVSPVIGFADFSSSISISFGCVFIEN